MSPETTSTSSATVVNHLAEVLRSRRSADPASSYAANLFAKGLDGILKKIGEESAETIIAAKSGDRAALVHEVADLWFHTLVLLTHQDLHPDEILGELARRFGRSGIAEKAGRDTGTGGELRGGFEFE